MAGLFGNNTSALSPLITGALSNIRGSRDKYQALKLQKMQQNPWTALHKKRNPLVGALMGTAENLFNPETQEKVKMAKAANTMKEWMQSNNIDPVKDRDKILEQTMKIATEFELPTLREKAYQTMVAEKSAAATAARENIKLDIERQKADATSNKKDIKRIDTVDPSTGQRVIETWQTVNGEPVKKLTSAPWKPSVEGAKVDVHMGKKMAESDVNMVDTVRQESEIGMQVVDQIDVMDAALQDMQTGRWSNLKIAAGEIAGSLGFDWKEDEVARLQTAKNAAGELVMKVLGRFKGAISNAEREFAADMMPKITNTRAARQFASEVLRITSKRAAEREDMMDAYLAEHGQLRDSKGGSFFKEWRKYREENPLKKEIGAAAQKYINQPADKAVENPAAGMSTEELLKAAGLAPNG